MDVNVSISIDSDICTGASLACFNIHFYDLDEETNIQAKCQELQYILRMVGLIGVNSSAGVEPKFLESSRVEFWKPRAESSSSFGIFENIKSSFLVSSSNFFRVLFVVKIEEIFLQIDNANSLNS